MNREPLGTATQYSVAAPWSACDDGICGTKRWQRHGIADCKRPGRQGVATAGVPVLDVLVPHCAHRAGSALRTCAGAIILAYAVPSRPAHGKQKACPGSHGSSLAHAPEAKCLRLRLRAPRMSTSVLDTLWSESMLGRLAVCVVHAGRAVAGW